MFIQKSGHSASSWRGGPAAPNQKIFSCWFVVIMGRLVRYSRFCSSGLPCCLNSFKRRFRTTFRPSHVFNGFRRMCLAKLGLPHLLTGCRDSFPANPCLTHCFPVLKRLFPSKMSLPYFFTGFKRHLSTRFTKLSLAQFCNMFRRKLSPFHFCSGFRSVLPTQIRASLTCNIEPLTSKRLQFVQPVLFACEQAYW